MIGKARRQVVAEIGAGKLGSPLASIDRPAVEEMRGAAESGLPWALAARSRPRKLSEESSATRRRQSGHDSQVLVDGFGQGVVELAQAVGRQGLVGRMRDWDEQPSDHLRRWVVWLSPKIGGRIFIEICRENRNLP